MAKKNPLPAPPLGEAGNNLFNLKSFNELKKDQTNIKIFKNSSFDSNFNSVQSLNTNLSHSSLLLHSSSSPVLFSKTDLEKGCLPPCLKNQSPAKGRGGNLPPLRDLPLREPLRGLRDPAEGNRRLPKDRNLRSTKNGAGAIKKASLSLQRTIRVLAFTTKREVSYPKISAILRAIRSIRLNRDEWKLIKYINLMEKKIRSNPLFGSPSLPFGRLSSSPFSPQDLPLAGNQCPLPSLKAKGGATPPLGEAPKRVKIKMRSSLRESSPKGNVVTLPPLKEAGGGAVIAPSSTVAPSSNNIFSNSPLIKQKSYNKIFTYNNIISKNILLRNMKYNFLKSTLSSILKKKIRRISEVLEEKPIKNYILYSYLKNCIFTPSHIAPLSSRFGAKGAVPCLPRLKRGRQEAKEGVAPPFALSEGRGHSNITAGGTKLSLNKYKGRKLGSFINYNKIIGFNFNSTAPFYQALPDSLAPFARAIKDPKEQSLFGGRSWSCNRYIKDTYKLLFYLFKSMYCLISKPVLKYTNDKVTIQLFYYLNIPKKKIFRLFSISYIKSIKKKWLAQSTTAHSSLARSSPSLPCHFRQAGQSPVAQGVLAFGEGHSSLKWQGGGRGNTKLKIRWKIRKAISRLKNKIIASPPLPKSRLGDPLRVLARQPAPFGGGSQLFARGGKNLLFLLRKFNLTKVYQNKFKLICAILSKKFNKPVELQLIRLHHPYHDSNILVNLLSLNIKNKRKKARVAIQKIYNKKPVKNLNDPNLNTSSSLPKGTPSPRLRRGNPFGEGSLARETGKLIPAFLSGLNIKIAGRLMGEPIIPRITTKVFGKGASATGKVNYLDVARITKKNRKGAYTIKITSGQNFF